MLKILLQLVIVSFLFANTALAYQPSLESLLNNGDNIDIAQNSVVANFVVEQKNAEKNLFSNNEVFPVEKIGIKLHIYNGNEKNPILARVHFNGDDFNNSSLINYDESLLYEIKKLIGHNENFEAEVFYGLMISLLNNQGRPLLARLKNVNPNIKPNVDLYDSEKMQLLARYKSYLIQKRNNENSEVENPLNPESSEEQDRVDDILKRPFLTKDTEIKRVKDGKDFSWVVDSENLYVKFDKAHHLRELKIKTSIGQMEIILGKFVLWNAQMQFPEYILLKTVEGKWYEIKPKYVSMFIDNKDQYDRRIKNYQKISEENKIQKHNSRPSFLL